MKQKKKKKSRVCYGWQKSEKKNIGSNGLNKVCPSTIIEEERKYLSKEELAQLKFLINFKNTNKIVSKKLLV